MRGFLILNFIFMTAGAENPELVRLRAEEEQLVKKLGEASDLQNKETIDQELQSLRGKIERVLSEPARLYRERTGYANPEANSKDNYNF